MAEEEHVGDDGKVVLFTLFLFRVKQRERRSIDGAIGKIHPA